MTKIERGMLNSSNMPNFLMVNVEIERITNNMKLAMVTLAKSLKLEWRMVPL